MTSAQVVETSLTNNSSFQNYSHPDDHTIGSSVDTKKSFTQFKIFCHGIKSCFLAWFKIMCEAAFFISVLFATLSGRIIAICHWFLCSLSKQLTFTEARQNLI